MKKMILALFLSGMALSCSSDDSSGSNLSDTPTAKAEYNTSNFGIYKGIFVGSSGTVFIDINNEGSLSATLVINGTSKTYTTSETVTENTAVEGLTFTNGSSSFDFNVSSIGGDAYVSNINISGHPNADIEIIKERSDALVKCYQGSFSGDSSGVFNLIISGNAVYGLAKENGADYSIIMEGEKSGNTITGFFEGGVFSGATNGNKVSGTWQNTFSESGSWSGNRKL